MDTDIQAGLPRRLTVADVMTREVVTAVAATTFKDLEMMMAENHISGIPVVDPDGAPIGVVSEADLLLKSEALKEPLGGWSPQSRRARAKAAAIQAFDLMSAPAITVDAGAPLGAAARLLRKHGVKRLPVVDGGVMVGVVSRADVLTAYLRSDEDLRHDVIEGVIRGSMWMDPEAIAVTVDDGLVRLSGEMERRSEVQILIELVRGVQGVVAVESTLTFGFDDHSVRPATEQTIS